MKSNLRYARKYILIICMYHFLILQNKTVNVILSVVYDLYTLYKTTVSPVTHT